MPSTYYGTRRTEPWLRPRLRQWLGTWRCGRQGHDYGEAEPVIEGRGRDAQMGSVRHCRNGCGCAIVQVVK